MAAPLFITLEGGEGSGKSTQLALLSRRLRECGQRVVTTREPGGTPVAERIRGVLMEGEGVLPETELLLMAAARAQHVRQLIQPSLARGEWVVCDRFADSTLAYQGYGRGMDREFIAGLGGWVSGGLEPHLTFLCDLEPELGLARARGRGADTNRFESDGLEFHRRVREGFLAVAAAQPRRVWVVDAAQPPERVAAAIWARVVGHHGPF